MSAERRLIQDALRIMTQHCCPQSAIRPIRVPASRHPRPSAQRTRPDCIPKTPLKHTLAEVIFEWLPPLNGCSQWIWGPRLLKRAVWDEEGLLSSWKPSACAASLHPVRLRPVPINLQSRKNRTTWGSAPHPLSGNPHGTNPWATIKTTKTGVFISGYNEGCGCSAFLRNLNV